MKKLSALLVIAAVLASSMGCYETQEGRTKAGVPFVKDTLESRYERPADQLFQAAKETLAYNGTLTSENTITKSLSAKIDTRTVWVKVDQVEPTISRIYVQARNKSGGKDIALAAEIDKQIALRLK
jgi:hypothetical protein